MQDAKNPMLCHLHEAEAAHPVLAYAAILTIAEYCANFEASFEFFFDFSLAVSHVTLRIGSSQIYVKEESPPQSPQQYPSS